MGALFVVDCVMVYGLTYVWLRVCVVCVGVSVIVYCVMMSGLCECVWLYVVCAGVCV